MVRPRKDGVKVGDRGTWTRNGSPRKRRVGGGTGWRRSLRRDYRDRVVRDGTERIQGPPTCPIKISVFGVRLGPGGHWNPDEYQTPWPHYGDGGPQWAARVVHERPLRPEEEDPAGILRRTNGKGSLTVRYTTETRGWSRLVPTSRVQSLSPSPTGHSGVSRDVEVDPDRPLGSQGLPGAVARPDRDGTVGLPPPSLTAPSGVGDGPVRGV